jgi:hypothetical protein
VPAGTASFDDVKSFLGRAGGRIGTTLQAGALSIQPFLSASIWHEFEDANLTRYVCTLCAFSLNIATSRVGTYGQFGAGASAALANTGWLGYARVDYRTGDNIEGWSINGGLRYQFEAGNVVAARY